MPAQAQQQQQQSDQQLAIAAALVIGTAATVAAALALLAALFAAAGITQAALSGALEVVLSFPPDPLEATGPAQAQVFSMNRMRRAQYLVAASRRITAALADARSHGQSQVKALAAAVSAERRYYALHIAAIQHRSMAAARVDSAAAIYGPLVGWYTVRDAHTTRECLAADGRNFYAGYQPLIGYPGTVHPRCRCFPGRPHLEGRMLPSIGAPERVRVPA
jgi:hypothetical protein